MIWQDKSSKRKNLWCKKKTNICDVNVDNIVISNLIETNNNSKYLIGYIDEVIKILISMLYKISEYVKTFKDKDSSKNKLMSSCKDDEKLLEMYKAIWTKIENLNIKLNTLPVYDDTYIETEIRTYGDKVLY